jgi:hypothetical protein
MAIRRDDSGQEIDKMVLHPGASSRCVQGRFVPKHIINHTASADTVSEFEI